MSTCYDVTFNIHLWDNNFLSHQCFARELSLPRLVRSASWKKKKNNHSCQGKTRYISLPLMLSFFLCSNLTYLNSQKKYHDITVSNNFLRNWMSARELITSHNPLQFWLQTWVLDFTLSKKFPSAAWLTPFQYLQETLPGLYFRHACNENGDDNTKLTSDKMKKDCSKITKIKQWNQSL